MSQGACRAALEAASPFDRAKAIDLAFPNCACEAWSLAKLNNQRVADDELLARILTSPTDYDESTGVILTAKLKDIWGLGLSVIRQGASDQEIADTVEQLTTLATTTRTLVGAVVVSAEKIRTYDITHGSRWFGVYATDDRSKSHHGDIFGTVPSEESKRGREKAQSSRRHRLAEEWKDDLIFASDLPTLLAGLRIAGI